jgi:hypothetical protein
MFHVVWLQTALDELAAIWTAADSPVRQAITAATHAIDQELQRDPHQGESRPGGSRVFFVHPLGIQFRVAEDSSTVRVFHVWDIRRHK